jgi:hypothetical protein
MDTYKAEFQKLKVLHKRKPAHPQKLAKIEAFDYWIEGKIQTEEQITAKS